MASAQHFPADERLVERIQPLVEEGPFTGVVLGVLESDGSRRVVSYGTAGPDARPLGERSVFDVGSIAKVFTAALLADMVARGEVSLTDPVAMHLPAEVTVPTWNGREITLLDLATHHSGLPRFPSDFTSPEVDYTVEQLYAFLADHELEHDIGSRFEYSNLGFGLLGHALARAAGGTYAEVVGRRILEPLGMRSSGYPTEGQPDEWAAQGHGPEGNVVPRWYLTEAFAGGGGLNSSAEDMLAFLAANLGVSESPLARVMAETHVQRRDMDGFGIGLGWLIRPVGDRTLLVHTGGTRGFRSLIAFDPESKVGIVLLANTAADNGPLNQLARELLGSAGEAP